MLSEYTIGQVSKRLGVSASTIKNWEQLGYIPKARRVTLNKVRVYTESQVRLIEEYIKTNY
jgi:DNA-binding transcriptional MerR regulator